MSLAFRWVGPIALSIGFCLGSPCLAVVILNGDGSGHTTAPSPDPGFGNVASYGDGSAVYLGNNWILTAAHVVPGQDFSITFSTGTFTADASKILPNPSGSGTAQSDLEMYHLSTNPGLPALSIAAARPAGNTLVTMIGAGDGRAPNMTGWDVASVPGGFTWTESKHSPYSTTAQGFNLTTDRVPRWGVNQINGSTDSIVSSGANSVIAMQTLFEEKPYPSHDAMAAPGDSGGGVFATNGRGQSQLVGIMVSVQPFGNQPANTAMLGEATFIADLSQYRASILSVLAQPQPTALAQGQNALNRFDVNNDGQVSPLDALGLVNKLNEPQEQALALSADGTSQMYYDVNGDNAVTPLDALQLVNDLNQPSYAPGSLSMVTTVAVPEPSSLVLLALGILGLGLAGRRR